MPVDAKMADDENSYMQKIACVRKKFDVLANFGLFLSCNVTRGKTPLNVSRQTRAPSPCICENIWIGNVSYDSFLDMGVAKAIAL
jgi:hypothetical protein